MKNNKEEGPTFKLPNDIVTVKFVPRKRGMAANVESNHVISGGMLTNSIKTYFCPLQQSGGLANILTKVEKDFLEEATGQNLSVYGEFWKTYGVALHKDNASNIFDMSRPFGYIAVRILEQYKDEIAHSWKARKQKPTYQFAITRPGEEVNEIKNRLDVKKLAFKLFGKIEEDKEQLIGILKLLSNSPVSKSSKLEWLQGKVQEHVDNNPSAFVALLKDASLSTKLLINAAIAVGVIKKNKNSYTTVDGLELCNVGETSSLNNTIRFLDDDKNQEIRLLIESRVEQEK